MEQGTPLSELGNDGSMGSDNDIVQQIMQDLNRPSQQNPLSGGPSMAPPQQMMAGGVPAMAPAPSGRMGMMNSPNPNSYMQHAMDPQSGQTAHMIGNSRPTPADFAALMGQGYMPNAMANGAYSAQQQGGGNYVEQSGGGTSKWMTWIFNELRIPIFVAIVFFLMSLPAANVMFAHLLPSLITPTGNFTVLGQLARAAVAGVAFWLLHRVLAPLVG
jgi:hypothetical protein